MKFAFVDGEKLGVYHDGKVLKMESEYITNYRRRALQAEKNREWKKNSDIMMYEGMYEIGGNQVVAAIHGIALSAEENKISYAFSVNESSGVYYKYLDDEKKTEAHIVSSNESQFLSLFTTDQGDILATVQDNPESSKIAIFSRAGGDYKCLTDGDSLDENPAFDQDGNVIFNSYGIGRDANNVFVTYMPSEIYRLNVRTLEIQTLVTNEKISYIKPMTDSDGNLYCIRKPGAEKEKVNVFLEILLIPVRIVQAIVGFISAFVSCFAGKPLVSSGGRAIQNGSAAKNGGADPKKVFVNNNLINVEKELNKNKKSEDSGFIPHSWKLVKFTPDQNGEFGKSEEKELASGVVDYFIDETDGEKMFVYSNGKHIFAVKEKDGKVKREKLVDTDFCLKVGGLKKTNAPSLDNFKNSASDGLFDML